MENEKKVRLSMEMSEDDHKYLKMCCVRMGMSIREFVIQATLDRVDLMEDEWMLDRWKKDGTRDEINNDLSNEDRIVYRPESVNGETVFKPSSYREFVRDRKLELASGL